jgi:predicted Zn-dependent peptidase
MRFTLLTFITLFLFAPAHAQKRFSTYGSDKSNGYTYKFYENDPLKTRFYTLENGLTVILSVNKAKPRIQTIIATKAGGKNDPETNTGLAHYLEHMLFKGTDKYGTDNFEKEKKYLDKIDALYEEYNREKDSLKRIEIYAQIDKASLNASKYSIANEYDKMLTSMGAKGTNAFTSQEVTAYINDIPSNQLHKFLEIEQERLRNPILRLFHTELEAVYEEKNISLDNDGNLQREQMYRDLFRRHTYGTQTILGKTEHLKNPSLKAIREYFNTYYVPNNMVVILSGDLDYDNTIEMVDKHFGSMVKKEVPEYKFELEYPRAKPREYTITGPQAESVMLGYRLKLRNNKERTLLKVVDLLLSNSEAGLIDLNLNKSQKVLSAYCTPIEMKDYSIHAFVGQPNSGQSLGEVKNLLLSELDKIKKGKFDTSLLKSLIANERVSNMGTFESNSGRAYTHLELFYMGYDYMDYLNIPYEMSQLTKEEIMDFANNYYTQDYCIVNKVQGKSNEREKIVKPVISNVNLNRDKESTFVRDITTEGVEDIEPEFINYEKAIQISTVHKSPLWYVQNKDNELFTLYYVVELGKLHDLKMPFAMDYLNYIGTEKYSAEEISKKFYSLACSYGVSTSGKESYVYLSGLQENFNEALTLFEHLLSNAQADETALKNLKERNIMQRENSKKSKRYLAQALSSYARYGKVNPVTYNLTNDELNQLSSSELISRIKNLTAYKHKIYYYGPENIKSIGMKITEQHVQRSTIALPKIHKFKPLVQENKVYFTNYDMVQASINWIATGDDYSAENSAKIKLFNAYFGQDMSSVVFQNIREAKALAYSTYAVYYEPSEKEDKCGIAAYIGTQADKLDDAISGMNELFKDLPESETSFQQSKESLLTKIRTERINKTSLFFNYANKLKFGFEEDPRHAIFHNVEALEFDDIKDFHKQWFKQNKFVYAIMGSKEKINTKELSKYGEVIYLSIEDLLNY